MKRLLLLFVLGVTAQLSASSPASDKEPWSWPMNDRIAVRLNSDQIRARIAAHASGVKSDTERAVMSNMGGVNAVTFVIQGARNPELFMPWELFERFLNATEPDEAFTNTVRARFSPQIRSFGWDIDTFWAHIDENARLYMTIRRELQTTNRDAESATALPAFDVAPPAERARELCSARADALERTKRTLGGDAFDQFLYMVVAPGVTVFADDPMNAAQLRHIAGGCR